MASNAHHRGYNIPLSQPSRLEALHSKLKGATPSYSTRRRDNLRVSEPIHDGNIREVRDHWGSDGEDHQWRQGEVAESSDRGSDGMEVNSLDVGGLLEELKERTEALESSMEEQERWNKEINQVVDRLYSFQHPTGTTVGRPDESTD
ncbi:hypothetical protein ASPSYDRAFT_95828 [Aspergillus sydowii CBS 593.65]|uniref:Uncharacterized protein n=1 Tax=Aspergillus sydowii CBS 593.65 TaxID=1036612 RepID=A0A1L9SY17_9EURO|nr:uncharacterized protein ASPSYDRAFT_95828 [Aspergillus sydowii CBS 593.65]OJJ52122.1 hypothetical protein ASPSYDRAFT_95828 [Aspergillus sydowii CBS 593.65]